MCLKAEKIETYRYSLKDDFYIEVEKSIKEDGLFEFYLLHKINKKKELMFSVYCNEEDFLRLILYNVDNHIKYYKETA